jgi:hypothetical protein
MTWRWLAVAVRAGFCVQEVRLDAVAAKVPWAADEAGFQGLHYAVSGAASAFFLNGAHCEFHLLPETKRGAFKLAIDLVRWPCRGHLVR